MESHRCARFAFPLTPLPQLRERYELGCELPEEAICTLAERAGTSRCSGIYASPSLRPASTYDITLTHFCRAFELFRLGEVSPTSLRRDPKPRKQFFQRICA